MSTSDGEHLREVWLAIGCRQTGLDGEALHTGRLKITISNSPSMMRMVSASLGCRRGSKAQPAGGWSTRRQNAPAVSSPTKWISVRTQARP